MPGSIRETPEHSAAGVVRQWLTRTFAGRTLLVGAALKLLVKLTRLMVGASPGLASRFLLILDTLGDVALVLGAVLMVRRLLNDVRGVLLWRVRRKLTLSYIFIGFVPVLLLSIFFLTFGLILFFNVSQYVAVSRIDALVDQAVFLADSAASGLQGIENEDDLQRRLRRRQGGAERTYPYASYAIVPTATPCGTGVAQTPSIQPARTIVVGPWRHVDPPASLPEWVLCQTISGLITYSNEPHHDQRTQTVHLAARAVVRPEDPSARYAVVVDIPLSAALLAKMQADTGIDYGDATAASRIAKTGQLTCIPSPLPGRLIDAGAAAPPRPARGIRNVLTQPQKWVAITNYIDWDTGKSNCQVTIGIKMTFGDMYTRIASNPGDAIDSIDLSNGILLFVLAIVGICFLLIQIVAFFSGLTLARSITGSVHELFTGTERVRLGDFTHKIPITSRDQLGELAQSFNSMTRSIADLLQQKAEKERMEQELRIARNIQMSLLPREPVTLPGLAVTAHCEPAREVGGDYYDYMTVGDQCLGVLIADVAGKGTSAALYMAELKGLMLSLSQLYTSPRELLIHANAIISRHLDSKSFITISYAVVDVARRTLTYARAGHTPLIYVPGPYATSRAAQILTPDGLVLGLQIDDGGQRFTRLLQEVTLPLGTGDVFLFYTDGLTEAMDGDGDLFGDARLCAIVQEHADAPFDELRDTILREITAFSEGTGQQDDMTMLLLRVEEVGARGPVIASALH
jgi:serine phosphatase RsbU (regulator of sigma subunit)